MIHNSNRQAVSRPSAGTAYRLRNEVRRTAIPYRWLIKTAGIGTAEKWLQAVGWVRTQEGWMPVSTEESDYLLKELHLPASKEDLAFAQDFWKMILQQRIHTGGSEYRSSRNRSAVK